MGFTCSIGVGLDGSSLPLMMVRTTTTEHCILMSTTTEISAAQVRYLDCSSQVASKNSSNNKKDLSFQVAFPFFPPVHLFKPLHWVGEATLLPEAGK